MDMPLIFGNRLDDVINEGVTQEGRYRPRLEVGVQARRRVSQANPGNR